MNSHSIKYSIINTYFYRYLYFQQQSLQGEEAPNEVRLDERMVEKLSKGESVFERECVCLRERERERVKKRKGERESESSEGKKMGGREESFLFNMKAERVSKIERTEK